MSDVYTYASTNEKVSVFTTSSEPIRGIAYKTVSVDSEEQDGDKHYMASPETPETLCGIPILEDDELWMIGGDVFPGMSDVTCKTCLKDHKKLRKAEGQRRNNGNT